MTNISPPTFVGREQELRSYLDTIKHIGRAHVSYLTSPISNLHAINGMGKTWLAYEIYRQATAMPHVSCAWIDFEIDTMLPDIVANSPIVSASEGIRQLWKVAPLAHKLDQPELDAVFEQKIHARVTMHSSASSERDAIDDMPFVLVIDAINQLEQHSTEHGINAWEYFQEHIIKPIVDQKRVFIICTSQMPVRWAFWELREVCTRTTLKPFNSQETAQLLEQYSLQENTDLIYDLTEGHPDSIMYIVKQHLEPSLHARDSRSDSREPAELPRTRYNEIEQRIQQLDPLARDLIQIIGVMRRIEAQPIHYVLKSISKELAAQFTNQKLHEALSSYREFGLVIDDPGYMPFSFTPDVRAFTELNIRRNDDEDRIAKIYLLLKTWYYDALVKKPSTNRSYLIDWISVSLQSLRLFLAGSDSREHIQGINSWLEQFQQRWRDSADNEMIERFYSDDLIQRLLRITIADLQQRVDAIVLGRERLQQNTSKYRKELVKHLFDDSNPSILTQKEFNILVLIAQQFSDGFDAHRLQSLIIGSGMEERSMARRKAQEYIGIFNQIHAITYQQEKGRFFMDEWLKDFLKKADVQGD